MKTVTRRTFNAMVLLGSVTALQAPVFAQEREVNVLLFSQPVTRGIQALADDFEAETGIKANIEVVGQDVFESRITLTFAGGAKDVDVMHLPIIQLQRWLKAGWIEDLTDEINSLEDKDDFLAGAIETYNVDGEYYGLPFFAEPGLMVYRKDILEAAGVEPPQTWEEMLEVAKAINSDETAAIAMRNLPGQGANMFTFPQIMRAYGGKFFADFPDDMTVAIDSPETLEALKLYIDLVNNYGPEGNGNFNFPEIIAGLQNGQVAMTVDGTGVVAQAVDPEASQFADKFAIGLPPAGPEGRFPAIAVHGIGVPAGVEDKEAAFEFIRWATSAETQKKLAMNNAYPDVTRASVASDSDVVAKYQAIEPTFLSNRSEALNIAIPYYRPLIPTWPQIGAAVGENINAAVNGLMSPEEALAAAAEEMNDILDN